MTKAMGPDLDQLKRLTAKHAVEEIRDGMVVGLGTGSTAAFAVEALALWVREGLQVVCIPTSKQTTVLARRLGVPLSDFARHRRIDLTIDGADEVERHSLHIIKGGGGALLREKIVANASHRLMIIIDETKWVDRLGDTMPVPVEVVPFGYETILPRLEALGLTPRLRLKNDEPFITDGGHYILDCKTDKIVDPTALERRLAGIVGVVESGLFINLASTIVVGHSQGIDIIEVERRS